jgi:hypothetical protein
MPYMLISTCNEDNLLIHVTVLKVDLENGWSCPTLADVGICQMVMITCRDSRNISYNRHS